MDRDCLQSESVIGGAAKADTMLFVLGDDGEYCLCAVCYTETRNLLGLETKENMYRPYHRGRGVAMFHDESE